MQNVYKSVALLLMVGALIFAVLLTVGKLEVRIPSHLKGPVPEDHQTAGPRVERIDLDKYFKMMGWEAAIFKYSDGFLETWLEVETDGKTEIFGKNLGQSLPVMPSAEDKRLSAESVRGHIIWARRNNSTEGEKWDLIITAGNDSGEDMSSSRNTNITPSKLTAVFDHDPAQSVIWGETIFRPSGGALRPNEEMILQTVIVSESPDQGDSKTRRTMRLKCKLLEAGGGGKE